ncbi:hypothetical protein K504DRAFT_369153 [Pleomassaria siparia CBS 279.74]|uniref:Cell wall protein n=1 Tax=Pleomassaria siparia CBS 279.74 TaxID=1314801 RepID=A0A6G1KJQ8_9PLEO|nr:hypothetical protein K504DRAFT_369153 [Pleomassaria siparia CBS 279.74]
MRSFSFIVALLFALVSSTYAWPEIHLLESRKGGNGTNSKAGKNGTAKGNSVDKMCMQMAKLTALTELAANTTKLDAWMAKGKINQTQIDNIKAKASNATAKLATMSSNTTLVSECLVVDAHFKALGQCKKMKQLSKLANLATNTTAKDAMVAKKNLNATQVSKLDEKIGNATTKLATMMSNTTLTAICDAQKEQKGSTGTTGAAAAKASASGKASAAVALSAQTMPYVLVPMLAGFFALFL